MFEMAVSFAKEKKGSGSVKEIRFTNFDDTTVEIFEKEAKKWHDKV
jgi:hypothetical protein